MTKLREIYRCPVCGNIVEVMNAGAGTLVCCGKPMLLLEENITDAAHEKHVPVVEAIDNGYRVKVGSAEHPMTDSHYIQWIELMTEKTVYRKELKPGDKPEAVFLTHEKAVAAREYCNLHGLWRG
ncbi:MAG: desulfoferrodoxin [Prevotella sp.]